MPVTLSFSWLARPKPNSKTGNHWSCRLMRRAPSISPWSLSAIIIGPTKSNDTAKPLNKGIESFSMRNILDCAWVVAETISSNSRLKIRVDV